MLIGDLTTRSLATALKGLEAQQQSHEQNIANVETPGYVARRAEFESSLRRAVERGRPETTQVDHSTSTDPTRIDGNNVNLANELTGLAENALKQQLVTEALNAQYRLTRAALAR